MNGLFGRNKVDRTRGHDREVAPLPGSTRRYTRKRAKGWWGVLTEDCCGRVGVVIDDGEDDDRGLHAAPPNLVWRQFARPEPTPPSSLFPPVLTIPDLQDYPILLQLSLVPVLN